MEKQLDKRKLSFPITFEKVNEIKSDDTRFTKLKCWLMHTGENYNNCSFSHEVIENAIPSLSYIPVVGFIEDNNLGEKDFSDHRYIITKDNGKVRRKYMGSAYGVILNSEDNNAHFETKICDDGIEREFIVADAIAWNFLEDSSQILNRDIIKDHSIELDENSIEGYEDEETGFFHFTKFSFRAACILGGSSQPAMEGSMVEVVNFTMSDFVKSIQSEICNKYNTFTKLVNEKNNQGGIGTMPNTDFTQTVMEQFEDISTMVSQFEVIQDRWGDNVPRYYLRDIQDNEVIVVDRKNNYHIYGFPFTMDGDKANIDFSCGSRKKTQYVNYEEGTVVPEGSFDFGQHISGIEEVAFSKVSDANTKVQEAEEKVATAEQAQNEAETNYSQVKADYDEIKPKYDEFVMAEQARLEAELDAQKDAEFAKYETALADSVEFAELKDKKSEMSLKDIEGECAILYARKTIAQTNFTKTPHMTAGIMDSVDEGEGYVATKYGNIPVKR